MSSKTTEKLSPPDDDGGKTNDDVDSTKTTKISRRHSLIPIALRSEVQKIQITATNLPRRVKRHNQERM